VKPGLRASGLLAILIGGAACGHDAKPVRGGGSPPADTSGFTAEARAGAAPAGAADSAPSFDGGLQPDSTDALLRRAGASAPADGAPDAGSSGTAARLVPLVAGLRLTSVNHYPDGDRENVVTLAEVSPEGVLYQWHYRDPRPGVTAPPQTLGRFVSAADLAGAPRLNQVFSSGERDETPGYTAMSLSRASYAAALAGDSVRYTVTDLSGAPLGGGILVSLASEMANPRVTLRGALARVSSAPESLTVLVDGRPTALPALHLRGSFVFQERTVAGDFWVLADSADPLILRETGTAGGRDDGSEWRLIRIDRPPGSGLSPGLEGDLERECRTELPGVYFAFASAELAPESHATLDGLARLLARHPDWKVTIEGHTDSIGDPAANQALSRRRAEAVRSALVSEFQVPAERLGADGFGADRPRESNATLEGRARNRRVEVARECGREDGKTEGRKDQKAEGPTAGATEAPKAAASPDQVP
jgi:outer membrane protein OmpA-like peptidoglycan-associated protein